MSVSSVSEITVDATPPAGARRTRIDAPHSALDVEPPRAESTGEGLLEIEPPSPELSEAVAGLSVEARREQLQLQVSQLAAHLRERLREVDRREAHLNARASQLEADLRASRIWLSERDHEFQGRELEFKRRIDELEERLALRLEPDASGAEGPAIRGAASANEAAPLDPYDMETRAAALAEREHALRLKEDELRERRFEVEREASALRHARQLSEQDRERELRDLQQDRANLASGLAEQSARLDAERAAFSAQRSAWEERRASQERGLAERDQAAAAEAADRVQRLDARQEWIERQKAGLDQVRSEVLALHRQSLEMRLIAEQLWAQISGRLTPSEVTRAIAQTRLKLSEQYQLEESALNVKRAELVALGERIAAQHAELKQLQARMREWTTAQQAEIEQQAQALVERELALDSEQDRLRDREQQWLAERRGLEHQIRALNVLRSPAAA